MMRFKFEFIAENQEEIWIPINYQYYLHSWFYNTLNKVDENFAKWLHDNGFKLDNFKYKMFTFSWLRFDKTDYKIDNSKIFIKPNAKGNLTFSFYAKEIAEKFIIAIFEQQQILIKNAKFQIISLHKLPDPNFKEQLTYSTMTPIKLSLEHSPGKVEYIAPDHPKYPELLKQNLEKKLKSLGLSIPDNYTFNFELLSKYRKKLVTVKEGRPDEIKIAGYLYQFRLTAPIELQKIGYYAGFGENNPMGFGLVKIRKK